MRAAAEIAQDKAQTLAEAWPLVAFVFEPPVEDELSWLNGLTKAEVEPGLAQALEILREVEPFDAGERARLEGALDPARRAARDQGAGPLPAATGRDHGDHDLPGDLRLAGRARARAGGFAGRRRALTPAATPEKKKKRGGRKSGRPTLNHGLPSAAE